MAELLERLQAGLDPAYHVVRELGGGGMSRVFLAEDVRLGRQVVVKVLLPELTLGASVERFERETHLAAQLQHPHIVPLLNAGSAQGLLYYTMPYVEGESLRARLAREGELPVADVLRILRDVLDALAYAHRHQVVHRDIKPDNVLLSGGHALVTDFGVAKAVAASADRRTLTSVGVALGTPLYMSPEQASADPHTDHRADIYSLGSMAYEMLCGRPPFVGMTPQEVLAAHLRDAPESIAQHRAGVPDGLNALVLRCLEKRPADRFQRAEELLAHVESLLTPAAGLVPTAPGLSPAVRAVMTGAHPARAAGVFGLASVGALGLVYLLVWLLGLPDWVLWGGVALLVAGLPAVLLIPAWFTLRRSLWTAGLSFGGLAVVAAAYLGMRALGIGPVGSLIASGVLEQGGRIVLADFADQAGDSSLATTFTEAFRVDLNQSRALRLMPAADLRATLQRMQRSPRSRITPDLAREIAVREGLKAVVTGEVNRAGGSYVLSTRLLDPETGNVLAAFRQNATDSTGIIVAIDRLSRQLRERAGESLRAIRGAQPLARVTTTSLPALRRYSLAQRQADGGDQLGALRLLVEAVQFDSTFAEAWRRGAVILGNLGAQPSSRRRAMTRAYRYSERLPEVERYMVRGSYFTDVTGDYRAAADALDQALALDSSNGPALNNAALARSMLREFDASAALYARAVALYPRSGLYRENLVTAHLQRGALDEARTALEDFRHVLPDHPGRWTAETRVAWISGQFDSVETLGRELLGRGRDPVGQRGALMRLMLVTALGGRRQDTDRYLRGDIRLLDSLSLPVEAFRDLSRGAVLQLALGADPRVLTGRAEQALRGISLDRLDPLDRPYLDLAAVYLAAERPDQAREWIQAYEANVPGELRGGRGGSDLDYLTALGMLALVERRPQDAIRPLREADRGACAVCTLPYLARAYDQAGMSDSAIALYQRYLTSTTTYRVGLDASELPRALKRVGELYEARGDNQKAVEYYARFADLWKNADPELQPVVRDVRERIARLAGEK